MEAKVKKLEHKSSLPKEALNKATTANQEEVRHAINLYKNSISQIVDHKVRYDLKLSDILNKYQNMEITRINAYRKSIENIVELQTKN